MKKTIDTKGRVNETSWGGKINSEAAGWRTSDADSWRKKDPDVGKADTIKR